MRPLHVRVRRRARRETRIGWGRLTWRWRPPPGFVIIGAQRGGTTSLFSDLLQHPQVVESALKEIHYFDLHHGRGEPWYRAHFPARGDLDRARRRNGVAITGEATPNYLFHPYAARWARHELAGARFIVLLRDPVERAHSHWKLMRRIGRERLPFEPAVAAEPERTEPDRRRLMADPNHPAQDLLSFSYLARGRYADQLEPWFRHLGRDRFLVLRTEDVFADRSVSYRVATDFLGLEPWLPDRFSHHNRAGTAVSLSEPVRTELATRLAPDAERLVDLLGPGFRWPRHPPVGAEPPREPDDRPGASAGHGSQGTPLAERTAVDHAPGGMR